MSVYVCECAVIRSWIDAEMTNIIYAAVYGFLNEFGEVVYR